MGRYKDQKEIEHRGLSASQIRANKCLACKTRNEQKKKDNIERDERLYEYWRSLSLEQQLTKLEKNNPKGAQKQKRKIKAKIADKITEKIKDKEGKEKKPNEKTVRSST